MPTLFLKVGWMARYQGKAGDAIFSTMKWVREHGSGHEANNFKPQNGKCYGYAPVPGIDIQKNFGAGPNDEYVDGVDVIWASNRPKPLGGLVIVGWYRNARVYRYPRPTARYNIAQASAADCTLLPIDERLYELPLEGPGSFRSAKNWYAEQYPEILKDVGKMLAGTYKVPAAGRRILKATDPDVTHRAEIEKIAIDHVTDKYFSLGYTVKSVEKDNLGWDLEATRGHLKLLLEVKGTAHSQISPLLTPNEYSASKKHRAAYHVCIVSEALSDPALTDLRYINDVGAWVDESGDQEWAIEPRTSGQVLRL